MQKQGQILFLIHQFGEHKLNIKQVSPWPISLCKPNSNRNVYSLLPVIHFASLSIGSHKQKGWVFKIMELFPSDTPTPFFLFLLLYLDILISFLWKCQEIHKSHLHLQHTVGQHGSITNWKWNLEKKMKEITRFQLKAWNY